MGASDTPDHLVTLLTDVKGTASSGRRIAALHKDEVRHDQDACMVTLADADGGSLPVAPQQLFPSGGP